MFHGLPDFVLGLPLGDRSNANLDKPFQSRGPLIVGMAPWMRIKALAYRWSRPLTHVWSGPRLSFNPCGLYTS